MAQVAGPLPRAALVTSTSCSTGSRSYAEPSRKPLVDFAIRSVKLALIVMLATTPAYGSWIATPLFHTLPDTLSSAISGQPPASSGASFDQFFGRVAYLGENISQVGMLTTPLPLIVSAGVWVIGALAAALGFGIFLLSPRSP